MKIELDITPDSVDKIITTGLTKTKEGLEDGQPRPDELLIISSLKRVIDYYTVQT